MGRVAAYRRIAKRLGIVGLFSRERARHSRGTSLVFSKSSHHPLRMRGGTSDKHVFDQVFVDLEYRCLDGLSAVRTIVDVGANVGYSSAYLMTRFPDAQLVAIEPDPGNFEILKRNLRPFGSRAVVRKAALWSEPTTLNFLTGTTDQGVEWGRQVTSAEGDGGVEAIDMPQVIDAYGLDEIDILKIDIEGAERTVFAASDLSWLDRVKNIVIELHGEDCTEAFMRAIAPRNYEISTCDELTVCLSKN